MYHWNVRTRLLCVAGASAIAAAASAQSGPLPSSVPNEVIVGEWVGRCESYGSTPAADCAVIGEVIPQQLEEMARIKAWMEPLRIWPEGPKLMTDQRTGKFFVQYVDYERSKVGGGRAGGKGMTNTVGGHSAQDGRFTFTQREVGEARMTPGPVTPGAAAPNRGAPAMLTTPLHGGWGKLVQFSAHEAFHSFQANSPFRQSLYMSGRSVTDMSVAWIREGSAEAVSYLYQQHRFGQAQPPRDTSYARPLNRIDDDGYDRGEFWLLLADIRDNSAPAKFLFDLHASAERIPHDGYDESITWLDRQLRGKGSSLRADYGRVIARVEDQDRYIPDGVTEFGFPEIEANSPEEAVEVRSDPMSTPALAATGFLAILRGKDLQPAEDKALPGKKLVWFEMLVDKESSPERIGLAVTDQWVDRNAFTRLLVPEGRDIGFFGRLTNVDGPSPATTESASAAVNLITRTVHLRGPGCVSVGRSYAIGAEYENNRLGSPPTLSFKSERGAFSGETYTAPKGPGRDKLMVQARAGGRDIWVPFAEFSVKPRCNLVIIGPGGERMTYDDDAKATRTEGTNGEPPAYADARGMVGYDPEKGRWVRVHPAQLLGGGHAGFGGMAFYTQEITKDGLKLNALNQGPLIMVEALKLMRRDIKQAKIGRETPSPCPTGGGTCIRLVVPSESGTAVYFDSSGEPVGFEADGEMTRIEYSGDPVVVPPA